LGRVDLTAGVHGRKRGFLNVADYGLLLAAAIGAIHNIANDLNLTVKAWLADRKAFSHS
jgi:hypothetical protein